MPLTALESRTFHKLRIASTAPETDEALTLTFDIPPELQPTFAFHPGQYLTLLANVGNEDLRRSYSICSGPGEPLRVAIKHVDQGRFSTWAHETLAPGHEIETLPPAGRFILPPATGPRSILAIAAGSGITPILAILKTLLHNEPSSQAALLYGSRTTAGILFRDELETLKDKHLDRFSLLHVLSREQQDIPMASGRLDGPKIAALLPSLFPGALPDLAFLCGPGPLIQTASAALEAAGLTSDRIRSERFSLDGEPDRPLRATSSGAAAVPHATARIIADGVATLVPIAEDETVLEAALRAGLDLPYSCRAGMCSTCRARVTEGTVTMDVNYGLEPWETAQGYVLTCQSRAASGHVVIDYDHV